MIVYGAGLSGGNRHCTKTPTLIAGRGAALQARTARIVYRRRDPHAISSSR